MKTLQINKGRSLRWFLMTGITLAVIIPVISIGIVTVKIAADSLREEIIRRNELLSTVLVEQIETYLQQPMENLFSLRAAIGEESISVAGLNKWLEIINAQHEYFIKLQIVDTDGIVTHVSPFDEAFIQIDMSRRDFFTESRKTGRPYWSPTFISPQLNQPVVTLSVPFKQGVVTGYFSLTKLTETVKKMPIGPNSFITITDQNGTFITHYDESLVYQRAYDVHYDAFRKDYAGEMITKSIRFKGKEMICYVDFITQTGWAIVIYQSVHDAFAPVTRLSLILGLGTLLILVITGALLFRHISIIIGILDRFINTTRGITSGNYDSFIDKIEYREFGELANHINIMAHSIQIREMDLQESEEKYRSIFRAAKDAIVILEHDSGNILDANDYACDLYGYKPEELRRMKNVDLSAEPGKTIEGLMKETNWIPIRYHRKKDGTVFPVEIAVSYHNQPDGVRISTSVIRDISKRIDAEKEKKSMENQLRQAQKMEAIGTLAGGIAHDFNNILSAIIGYSELIELNPQTANTGYGSDIEKILKAAHRAKELVQQILTFSRQTEQEAKPIKIGSVVSEALKLLRASLPTTVTIRSPEIESASHIIGDPTQIHQIVMNLCTNAAHAMRLTGGVLEVEVFDLEWDAKHAVLRELKPGPYVHLTVRDNGGGISRELMDRIFDPYFTTKQKGEGTGLGLAVVHGIVQSHGGSISVESTFGKGSVFNVYLPRLADADIESDLHYAGQLPRGEERILFIDDEVPLADLGKRMLEGLGYHVVTKTDSREALEAFRAEPRQFDLVVTDMTMPKMTGEELTKKILAINPDIPVILCTGFSELIDANTAHAYGFAAFIYKPLELRKLAEMVRNVIDKGLLAPIREALPAE